MFSRFSEFFTETERCLNDSVNFIFQNRKWFFEFFRQNGKFISRLLEFFSQTGTYF